MNLILGHSQCVPCNADNLMTGRGLSVAGYLSTQPKAAKNCIAPDPVVPVASYLDGLLWMLPCTGPFSEPWACQCGNQSSSGVFGGDEGTIYNVKLLIRGNIEFMEYAGGTFPDSVNAPHFKIGGTPGPSSNIYRLRITPPGGGPVDYFLNQGTIIIVNTSIADTVTIPIEGGSAIDILSDNQDGYELANPDNVVIRDVHGIPFLVDQPYDGQFIQVNVLSVTAT